MDRSARRLPVPTAGPETCGGVESFRLLICFQSCPPCPFLLSPPHPPTLYHLLLSHSLRSLVSWAICRTRWAGLTLSSSGRRRGGEVRQSFIYCSDSSRALRSGTAARFLSQEASRWKNAQISSGCSFEGSFHQASRSLGGKKRSPEDPKVFVLQQQQRFFCGGGRSSWKTNRLKQTVFVILVRMFGEVLSRCDPIVEHFT